MQRLITVATVLLTLLVGSAASAKEGVVYAQAGTQAVVELNVETAPELVINRKNPPVLTLHQPFTEAPLTAEVTGEPWEDEPELYFVRLEPVTWQLQVPEGTEPGSYPVTIEADFALCDNTSGVCFTEAREVAVTLHVDALDSDTGDDRAATLFLETPEF